MLSARNAWSALALAAAVTVVSAPAPAAECVQLKASYRASMRPLVATVRAKSPALLVRYVTSVNAVKSGPMPTRSQALKALASVEPACIEELGAAECGRIVRMARAFIEHSSALGAKYQAQRCPGSLVD